MSGPAELGGAEHGSQAAAAAEVKKAVIAEREGWIFEWTTKPIKSEIIKQAQWSGVEMKVFEEPTKDGIRQEVTWRSDGADIYCALEKGQKHERNSLLEESIGAYAKPLKYGNLSLNAATAPLGKLRVFI